MASANVNIVAIVGNLTRDPELREVGSTTVCNMRIAVNGTRKDGDQWVEKPNFFNVTVWGAQGENCARYLEKGRPCAVQGRLDWREWDDKDGNHRESVEIVADRVQFLGSRDGGGGGAGGGDGGGSRFTPQTDLPADADFKAAPAPGSDDDIPF